MKAIDSARRGDGASTPRPLSNGPRGTVGWARSPADPEPAAPVREEPRPMGSSPALFGVICCGFLPVLILVVIAVVSSGAVGAGAVGGAAAGIGLTVLLVRARRGKSEADGRHDAQESAKR